MECCVSGFITTDRLSQSLASRGRRGSVHDRKHHAKRVLRLAAAATASTALAGRAAVAQDAVREDVAVPEDVVGNQPRTLIRDADVLTMDPTLGEQLATDVLVENGRVVAVGKGLAANGADVIDAQGMILMPGMIDGHRHVWTVIGLGRMTKFSPSDYPYFPWKMAAVVAMEPEDHYIAELVGGLQAIDSGVTSILDYAHGQDTEAKAIAAAQGLKDSGIAGWFAYQLGISYPFELGDTVSIAARMIEAIFTARSTEQEWNTAARLQNDLFHDRSAPATARARTCYVAWCTGSMTSKDEWARVRSSGVELLVAHLHKPENPHPAGFMGHRGFGNSGPARSRLAWPRLSCGSRQSADIGRAGNVAGYRRHDCRDHHG